MCQEYIKNPDLYTLEILMNPNFYKTFEKTINMLLTLTEYTYYDIYIS